MAQLTGERPRQGVTPDSLLALHEAGYREVRSRLGSGRVLDVGCGEGFSSRTLVGPSRSVVGVDYSGEAVAAASAPGGGDGLPVAQMDATALGIAGDSFDWVCSSHLVEHFADPAAHVSEVSRVLAPGGAAFFITPNRPADFENPFHIVLFDPDELRSLLSQFFGHVTVFGLDGSALVKADFAARRAKAQRILALDFLDLRHRMPRRWYIGLYTHLLPLAYRIMARSATGGSTGISDRDFSITTELDETTLVLFAVAREPRQWAGGTKPRV